MLFNSFQFILFFPIVIAIYFVVPKKVRYIWLFAASYYFYMCWDAKYALLLLLSTAVTWLSGFCMEKAEQQDFEEDQIRAYRKWCVALSFILNLSILIFFKYFYFVVDNINVVLEKMNMKIVSPGLNIILPVGISFYIFQALGYTVDVYRKEIKAEKNFMKYALFISFFPQLVAGPVERSKNLLRQMENIEHIVLWNYERIRSGFHMMLWGYFQKLVIADRIAIVVKQVYDSYTEYGFVEIGTVIILFSFQIYCDFGGYSIIAKGAAQIMGFELMDNFRQPYLASNIHIFWKRWHISMTSWFTDYLYIPLGGNRKGKLRQYLNIMIVFLCSGLWHGANWTYVIWGCIHGAVQVVGKKISSMNAWRNEKPPESKWKNGIYHVGKIGATFGLVSVAWVFFRADTLSQAFGILGQMFRHRRLQSFTDMGLSTANWAVLILALLLLLLLLLLLVDMIHEQKRNIRKFIYRQNIIIRWAVYSCGIWMVILFGVYGVGYDASRFIYFQF